MRIRLHEPPHRGQLVAKLREVAFAYGTRVDYSHLNLEIDRGDHVVLVGPNGAGKTALRKLLAGIHAPTRGEVAMGSNGFPPISPSTGSRGSTRGRPTWPACARSTRVCPRGRCATGSAPSSSATTPVGKPVSAPSGGEKTHLCLARILTVAHNSIMMNEPTNHLDLPGRDILEEALRGYQKLKMQDVESPFAVPTRSLSARSTRAVAGKTSGAADGAKPRRLPRVTTPAGRPVPSRKRPAWAQP